MARSKKNQAGFYNVYDMTADPTRSLACYFAQNPQQAISRFVGDQVATASTFRKSQPMTRFGQLEARLQGAEK